MKVVFWDDTTKQDVTVLDAEDKAVCTWPECNERAVVQLRITGSVPHHECRVHADNVLSKLIFIGVLP
ncbi:hypothetical protein BI084_gp48 [Gordonia phage Terapin]|uniref:Uncharacterized protein n=5 Tax=Terapinvirus terapin TaxID=2734283 RepID=A0A345MB87_9CAUD|nr:hypothetical protein BI084_gp48 [Gordonia phage Terapin]AVP43324.1 hypothetical protein PBI_DJOKOVIC_47 [Gordonia phage Djokovic]AXH67758.1 hypothetical protein SEA_BEYONCAGE_47 [Gordonia phage Beyoncage]QOC56192.1 hypothetical protein SEA_SIENNA_47 [Gordonia phage Sienna]QOC56617.1 hypothetical protein SEA_BITESIZE_47 [Gordonia phage BiteSize]QYW00850.1 hypothetical protein SEA_MADI_47 [Gordonia phage Madi]